MALKVTTTPTNGQQDAEHQGEVARPHAGAVTHLVVGRAPGKGNAHGHEQQAGEKVFLTLDVHLFAPR
jgi:hypothetical protein